MAFYKIHERAINGEDFKQSFIEINNKCGDIGIENPIFIMDNARIHHYRGLNNDESISSFRIVYLPPYSQFLNPIENVFSVWKNSVIREAVVTEEQLRRTISRKFEGISAISCSSFYRKMLGYLNRCIGREEILE